MVLRRFPHLIATQVTHSLPCGLCASKASKSGSASEALDQLIEFQFGPYLIRRSDSRAARNSSPLRPKLVTGTQYGTIYVVSTHVVIFLLLWSKRLAGSIFTPASSVICKVRQLACNCRQEQEEIPLAPVTHPEASDVRSILRLSSPNCLCASAQQKIRNDARTVECIDSMECALNLNFVPNICKKVLAPIDLSQTLFGHSALSPSAFVFLLVLVPVQHFHKGHRT